jgi:phosphoribosylglycinamide formyltransferase-1
MKQRWALFISGRGSTAQAVMDLMPELSIRLVVSSQEKVWGLVRAKRSALPVYVFSKPWDWQKLDQELRKRRITHIFLLGFMKLIPAEFLTSWQNRIWNLHPSLLPLFPGLQAIEKSYATEGDMGVTVHDVIAEMDAGQIRMQKIVMTQEQKKQAPLSLAQLRIAFGEQQLVRQWSRRMTAWNP